jgi:hypothetical protein
MNNRLVAGIATLHENLTIAYIEENVGLVSVFIVTSRTVRIPFTVAWIFC